MTLTGISGRYALIKIALETTQISVQSPTNVTVISSFSAIFVISSARIFEPNVGLSVRLTLDEQGLIYREL